MATGKNLTDVSVFSAVVHVPLATEDVDAGTVEIPFQALANRTKYAYDVVTDGLHVITCLDVEATTLHGNAGTVVGVFGAGAGNGGGVAGQGAGFGVGVNGTGGPTGIGVVGFGGSTSGVGVAGTGGSGSPGVRGTGGSGGAPGVDAIGVSNAPGITTLGNGPGAGIAATGGASGNGVTGQGGASAGTGVKAIGGAGGWGLDVGTGNATFSATAPIKTADPGAHALSSANVCKAWGIITIATTTATLVEGYGIASVAVDSDDLTINLSHAMATANYAPVASTSGTYVPEILSLGASQFKIRLVETPPGSANVQAIMNAITTTVFVHVYGRQ